MADEKSYLKQVDSGVVRSNPEAIKEALMALDDAKKQKELEIQNQELQKKLYKVVNENLRVLEPKSEFEKLDEYWILYKQIHANDFEKRFVEFDSKLRQLDKMIKVREERVAEMMGDTK